MTTTQTPADPHWRKNRIQIISKREFEYKNFQCLNSSKNGDLATPNHKPNSKKVPGKSFRNSSRKLRQKSSQISGFPIISFLLDGDASPLSTPSSPKTASIRGKLFQNENSNIKIVQCLNSSKNGDLATPNHKPNSKKSPGKK